MRSDSLFSVESQETGGGTMNDEPGGPLSGVEASALGDSLMDMVSHNRWPVYLPKTFEAQASYIEHLSKQYPPKAVFQDYIAQASQKVWDNWHSEPGDPH
jgi:hypothetical protein